MTRSLGTAATLVSVSDEVPSVEIVKHVCRLRPPKRTHFSFLAHRQDVLENYNSGLFVMEIGMVTLLHLL